MSARITVLAVAGFVIVLSYADPGRSQTPESNGLDPVEQCRKLASASNAMTAFEKNCSSSIKSIVERTNKAVNVKLRNGSVKSFKISDVSCMDPAAKKECINYHIGEYFWKIDAVIVDRWLDAGPTSFQIGSYMIDRGTGRVIDLPDVPNFSPDGTRFIALSICYDHCANRIDVWSIKDGPAKLEWRHRMKQEEESYYYKFLEWQGNERAKIQIFPEEAAEGDTGRSFDENRYSNAWIVFDGSGWKIEKATK